MPSTATQSSRRPAVLDRSRALIVGGLLVGAVLGFTGNFFEKGDTQSILYGISAVGMIVASILVAMEQVARRDVLAAAGFAVLALGETRVLNVTTLADGEAAFAAGVFLYAPGLILIALSAWGPAWTRVSAALSGVAFGAHALVFFGGGEIDSTGPLAGVGYALLTLTFIAWAVHVLRADDTEVTA